MKERPIVMTPENAQKCHIGAKTQTRRLVKLPAWSTEVAEDNARSCVPFCPYGQVGDRLWVRENGWERPARTPKMLRDGADTWERFYFDALLDAGEAEELKGYGFKRRPSIHMPRWACRTVLEITDVRVERLQEISEEDAIAEGVTCLGGVNGTYDRDDFSGCWTNYSNTETAAYWNSPIDSYHSLWDSINGVGSWALNPWVWVIEFRRSQS